MHKAASSTYLTKRFFTDRAGNFGMITALLLPVLLGVGGLAMEFANAMQKKANMQETADAAALAAATHLLSKGVDASEAEATNLAFDFIFALEKQRIDNNPDLTQAEKDAELAKLKAGSDVAVKSTPTTNGKIFQVTANLNYSIPLNPLLGFLGATTMNVRISTTSLSTLETGAPISMYLALDRSGSMSFKTDTKDTPKSCPNYTSSNWSQYPNLRASTPCYVTKIQSLKTAVAYLVQTLQEKDPSNKNGASDLVRTGAVSYNDASQTPQVMGWGTKDIAAYVNKLPEYPTGGTNARDALTTAYNALKRTTTATNDTETAAHKLKNNTSFERYIVFMTDGEMTGSSSTWNSSIDAQVRKVCADAKADKIKIFSIAFMAPQKGKELLENCATPGYYYEPESQEEIVAAFGDIARKATNNMSRLTN